MKFKKPVIEEKVVIMLFRENGKKRATKDWLTKAKKQLETELLQKGVKPDQYNFEVEFFDDKDNKTFAYVYGTLK